MNHKISSKLFIFGMILTVVVGVVGSLVKVSWTPMVMVAIIVVDLIQASIYLKCPKCGGSLNTRPRSNYCPHCGTEIDWE